MNIVEHKIKEIYQLCKLFGVDSLYLFGSALTNRFSDKSDIDFLVNFGRVDLYNYFDNYMGLKENLGQLFGRSVDLVEEKTIKNPVLRNSINRNKKLIYG
jgi:predicted nucleotidyltransferase